jgi:hypothetical protein
MSRNNGKLASLNENCVLVVSACDSPSFVPHHFHCLACNPAARLCSLNFPNKFESTYMMVGTEVLEMIEAGWEGEQGAKF